MLSRAKWLNPLPHRHAELEFNLIVRGRAVCVLFNRKYEFRAGMLTWLFPAQGHLLAQQSDDFEMWVAVFSSAPDPPLHGRL